MEHVLRALSNWLVQQDAIESSDRELYEYAIYSFLISVMPLAIFLIVSGIMGMLLEGLLIVIPFMVIRKFSGGYHARHAFTCMFISVGLLTSSFYVITHADCSWLFHILAAISGLSVAFNSPIDSENKRLKEDEIKQYRHTTYLLIIISVGLYSVLVVLHQTHYAVCIAVSLVLTALMQLPCILKKKNERMKFLPKVNKK